MAYSSNRHTDQQQRSAPKVVSGSVRPPIRLLLFDLDDTLWDLDKTLDVAERKWQSMMRRWGLDDIADSYNNYHVS